VSTNCSLPPLRAALIAQILGALIAIGLIALISPSRLDQPLLVAALQGVCAAFTGYKLDAPPWWLPIHLGFMPLVALASMLHIPPGWYLAAFLLLVVVYWRVGQSRVPLYLSSKQTAEAIAALLPEWKCQAIDLGCGNGALLRRLAQLRPDCMFFGVEYAPLLWLWARLTCAGVRNCKIVRGDYWRMSLAGYDLVYAFLSPVPMPDLWDKARQEMKADALLVSNTFEVPDQSADRLTEVTDRRRTRLFCYLPGRNAAKRNR
jgi:hypothetical protein